MAAGEGPQASGTAYLRLVLLGAAVGIPAALVAALFLGLVHEAQHVVWADLPDALGESAPPWYLIVGIPVLGAAIVAFARIVFPGNGGKSPLDGLSTGPTPISYAPGIALAAFATLTCGAVLGPEAPVIALGAVTAALVASFAALGDKERTVIQLAGSFAAVSALFGGPIVGGVLLLEAGIGLGAALIPTLIPGFVAAAVGYVIFIGLGDWGGLETPGLVVPGLELYDGTSVVDLLLAVAVGVVLALILVLVRRLTHLIAARANSKPDVGLLLAGGLAVGLIALAGDGLGADSQDILFSGQASISPLVGEASTGIVLVLLVAKALAYAISLASGFRGGPIFPAVFLGVGIATLPVIWFDVSATWAIAVGAAAGLAAEARLILSSMLFGALLVGTQGLDAVPAAVLAAVAAWVVTMAIERRDARSA